jgi:hypothetical protein
VLLEGGTERNLSLHLDISVFLDNYRNIGQKRKSDSTIAVLFNAVKSFFHFLRTMIISQKIHAVN